MLPGWVALSAWQIRRADMPWPARLLWRGAGHMPASPNSLTHGRDLAQGTGQPAERPEAPAEQELAFARTNPALHDSTHRTVQPCRNDADDAPAIDRPSPSSALCHGSTS